MPTLEDLVSLATLGAFVAGLGLGFFFFGGLWWTVKQLPTARHPATLSLLSLLARTGLTVVGFYIVMDGHWERVLVCMVGFLIARSIMIRGWFPGARRSLRKPSPGSADSSPNYGPP